MRIVADEVLELARRYEASGGLETTLGDFLRPRVKDELNRIARRTANRSARDIVIALQVLVLIILGVSVLLFLVTPGTTKLDMVILLSAMVFTMTLSAVSSSSVLTITESHSGRNDASDKDYGKLLAAYRMLGGDESQLKPYAGIDAAQRVAAGFHERPADDGGAEPADAEPRDVFLD